MAPARSLTSRVRCSVRKRHPQPQPLQAPAATPGCQLVRRARPPPRGGGPPDARLRGAHHYPGPCPDLRRRRCHQAAGAPAGRTAGGGGDHAVRHDVRPARRVRRRRTARRHRLPALHTVRVQRGGLRHGLHLLRHGDDGPVGRPHRGRDCGAAGARAAPASHPQRRLHGGKGWGVGEGWVDGVGYRWASHSQEGRDAGAGGCRDSGEDHGSTPPRLLPCIKPSSFITTTTTPRAWASR